MLSQTAKTTLGKVIHAFTKSHNDAIERQGGDEVDPLSDSITVSEIRIVATKALQDENPELGPARASLEALSQLTARNWHTEGLGPTEDLARLLGVQIPGSKAA